MSFYEFAVAFAPKHPFLSFFMIYFLYKTAVWPFIICARFIRSRNIKSQGWPTNPLMDADGDIVHPEESTP